MSPSPSGVLVVDKPAGPTSHDVVAVVRRALGVDKVGHTGTLDPLATGVLPLVVGRATRLASFLSSAEKEYVAQVRFGAATPTYDAEGTDAIQHAEVPATPGVIESALSAFTGTYLQQPPPFSAKKVAGTPAYKLARAQQTVAIKPVEVTVRSLDLCGYRDGVAELRLVSSTGFYVRTLAHELGQRVGCGAYLQALRRTRSGEFGIDVAHPLAAIVEAGAAAADALIPMGSLLPAMPSVTLNDSGLGRAGHGNALRPGDWVGRLPEGASEGGRVRLLDASADLLGIGEWRPGGLLHPVVVLV